MLAYCRVAAQTLGAQGHRQDVVEHGVNPRTFLRAGVQQQFGRGGEHHLDDLVARQMQRRPEQKVRSDQPHHRGLDPWRQRWRGISLRRRLVGQRHQQHQRTDPARVADGHLQRRRRASRTSHHGGLGDTQCVEQADMGVSLRQRRCIGRHGRAQVAEARHRDDADAVRGQPARERHALVVSAAAAVYGQQRHAGASLLVFDRAAACGQQHAALCSMGAGTPHVVVEPKFHQQRCAH